MKPGTAFRFLGSATFFGALLVGSATWAPSPLRVAAASDFPPPAHVSTVPVGSPDASLSGTSGRIPFSDIDPEIDELRGALQGILATSGGRQGRWSVLAVSLDRGDTLLALAPSEPMIPASNMKLLTTAAALWYLGPDYRYSTFLLADGPQNGGTLDGDLILYGTGDPTLSARFFPTETAPLDSLAQALRDRGIEEVRGNLVVDGSYFRGPELHPEWDPLDLNDAFAAPVSAVSFNENLVTVRVQAGGWVGAPPTIFTLPEGSDIPVENVARTLPSGTRSRIWLLREDPRDPIGIEGEIPLNGRDVWRDLPVPDPLRYTGLELKRALEQAGIRISGSLEIVRAPGASRLSTPVSSGGPGAGPGPRILVEHRSPPLLEILTITNKQSHNFFAETVGKTLGRAVMGDGSFSGGSQAVRKFLTEEVGVPVDQVMVRDGSGLSTLNRASAGVFVQLLDYMHQSALWADYWSTLPEAGVRNELRRMSGSPASRNLRAKTGTLNRVSALSGMVRTRSGERILFSVLSNDVTSEYRAKRAEDQIGIRLASLTRPLPPEAEAVQETPPAR